MIKKPFCAVKKFFGYRITDLGENHCALSPTCDAYKQASRTQGHSADVVVLVKEIGKRKATQKTLVQAIVRAMLDSACARAGSTAPAHAFA